MAESGDRLDPELAGQLALSLAPLPLSPQARVRLRERVLSAAAPGMRVVRHDAGDWMPLLRGITVKTLRRDEAAGSQTALWRLEPGAVIPAHPHRQQEECMVLEGEVVHEGVCFRSGDYLSVDAGASHAAFTSPGGALLLIRSDLLPAGPG